MKLISNIKGSSYILVSTNCKLHCISFCKMKINARNRKIITIMFSTLWIRMINGLRFHLHSQATQTIVAS